MKDLGALGELFDDAAEELGADAKETVEGAAAENQ